MEEKKGLKIKFSTFVIILLLIVIIGLLAFIGVILTKEKETIPSYSAMEKIETNNQNTKNEITNNGIKNNNTIIVKPSDNNIVQEKEVELNKKIEILNDKTLRTVEGNVGKIEKVFYTNLNNNELQDKITLTVQGNLLPENEGFLDTDFSGMSFSNYIESGTEKVFLTVIEGNKEYNLDLTNIFETWVLQEGIETLTIVDIDKKDNKKEILLKGGYTGHYIYAYFINYDGNNINMTKSIINNAADDRGEYESLKILGNGYISTYTVSGKECLYKYENMENELELYNIKFYKDKQFYKEFFNTWSYEMILHEKADKNSSSRTIWEDLSGFDSSIKVEEILEIQDKWLKIKLNDGEIGWVYIDDVVNNVGK